MLLDTDSSIFYLLFAANSAEPNLLTKKAAHSYVTLKISNSESDVYRQLSG